MTRMFIPLAAAALLVVPALRPEAPGGGDGVQRKGAALRVYRERGGSVELELFPDMPHGFARTPGPESDRALELMKAFVAGQLTRANAPV